MYANLPESAYIADMESTASIESWIEGMLEETTHNSITHAADAKIQVEYLFNKVLEIKISPEHVSPEPVIQLLHNMFEDIKASLSQYRTSWLWLQYSYGHDNHP